MNQKIIDFYSGVGTDDQGRTLEEILLWGSDELENVHDYVQLVFPTDQPSRFNPTAPVLDEETIEAFTDNNTCMRNLVCATERMLDHFGFKKRPNGLRTVPGKIISYRTASWRMVSPTKLTKPWWVEKGDHNYLRFTRILRCLNLMGLNIYAEMVYQLLSEMYENYKNEIGEETLKHWYCAAFENDLYSSINSEINFHYNINF